MCIKIYLLGKQQASQGISKPRWRIKTLKTQGKTFCLQQVDVIPPPTHQVLVSPLPPTPSQNNYNTIACRKVDLNVSDHPLTSRLSWILFFLTFALRSAKVAILSKGLRTTWMNLSSVPSLRSKSRRCSLPSLWSKIVEAWAAFLSPITCEKSTGC